MAAVITVAQRKGGAGKTTLAAHLAAALAVQCRVGLIDADPQRTLSRWHALRAGTAGVPAIACVGVAGWRLPAELARLARTCDVVLIDSAPHVDTDARVAIRAAGLVLVPVQPSPPDLWAAADTMALAAEERRPAWIVLNRVAAGRLAQQAQAEVARLGWPRLQAGLGSRAAYASAFARGRGVTETDPRSVAAREVLAVRAEVLERLRAG